MATKTTTNPYWSIHHGNVLDVLPQMPAKSVHMVVTSPPYWGLRDYGLGQWQGGDAECGHEVPRYSREKTHWDTGKVMEQNSPSLPWPDGVCGLCGAVQQAAGIGLEPTLGEWVANIVEVSREVHRVLRDDGTFWLNLGDAYSGSGKGDSRNERKDGDKQNTNKGSLHLPPNRGENLPAKNLMGQPWRVAFALQDDGWVLRSAIIWHKLNPMPESTRDRPTSSYEMVFLLSKGSSLTFWTHQDGYGSRTKPAPDYRMVNGKQMNMWQGHNYFYDAEAIRTPWVESSIQRLSQPTFDSQTGGPKDPLSGNRSHRKVLEHLHHKSDKQRGHARRHDGFNDRWDAMPKDEQQANGANARNVWSFATQGYPGAHFATFPEELPKKCILAGTSEKGVCGECGAPWARVMEHTAMEIDRSERTHPMGRTRSSGTMTKPPSTQTLGWQPTCDCNAAVVPATVLDPFAGSGTTGVVALRHSRNFLGVELNPEYIELARKRITDDNPLLNVERTP